MKTGNAHFEHTGEWFNPEVYPDCATCRSTVYDPKFGEEPPCEFCPMTTCKLNMNNQEIYDFWQLLDQFGRSHTMGGESPIQITALKNLADMYDIHDTDFLDRVFVIESILYPYRMKKRQEKEEKRQKQMKNKSKRAK